MSPTSRQLGMRIKKLRESRKMSQQALAKKGKAHFVTAPAVQAAVGYRSGN